jgi:adenylylsulfate kinase-like enzyme
MTNLNQEENKQSEEACVWIKARHKKIIQDFAGDIEDVTDTRPTTLFMAGSPGAGKTEISKSLIAQFKQKPLRIDADEIREICVGYSGSNAHVFQKAATKGVHMLYDYALKRNINVILDGTFAYGDSLKNIQRSLDHRRKVEIFFIYQNPLQAWEFTKKRETVQQRRVSKEIFMSSLSKACENVSAAKEYFGSAIELNLIIKDYEKNFQELKVNIDKTSYPHDLGNSSATFWLGVL